MPSLFANNVRIIRFNGTPIARSTVIVLVPVPWPPHFFFFFFLAHLEAAAVVPQVVFSSKEFRIGISVVKSIWTAFTGCAGRTLLLQLRPLRVHHLMMLVTPSEKRQKLMQFEKKNDVFKGDTYTLLGVEKRRVPRPLWWLCSMCRAQT